MLEVSPSAKPRLRGVLHQWACVWSVPLGVALVICAFVMFTVWQAILVLRVATRESAQAEDMARDPASPSRLWLGELPTSGGTRPGLQGTLKQETYIRVLIPVKQAPVKK